MSAPPSQYRLGFDEPDGWETLATGVRSKRVRRNQVELRLLELTKEAQHPHWCVVGHSGCVIDGVLEVEFDGGVVRYEAGDGLLIPPGEAHRHRPRALTVRVRLALTDYPR